MTNHCLNRAPCSLAWALCAAILAGCGGDGETAATTDTTVAKTPQEQQALNRAVQANANALSQVKGERATGQSAP